MIFAIHASVFSGRHVAPFYSSLKKRKEMEKGTNKQPNRRKRTISFDPNHEFISDAVNSFLKQGGKIKQLQAGKVNMKDSLNDSWIEVEDNTEADEFLND